MRLDLGCGEFKKKGYIGIDLMDFSALYPKGEFIQWDLSRGMPPKIKDNSVDKIYAGNFLEHLGSSLVKEGKGYAIKDGLIFMLEEIYRVCRDNAEVKVNVPHFTYSVTFEFHRRHFACWDCFTKQYGNYDFRIMKKRLVFNKKYCFWDYLVEPVVNLSKYFIFIYERTFLKSLFPAREILVSLRVVKKGDGPHNKKIKKSKT